MRKYDIINGVGKLHIFLFLAFAVVFGLTCLAESSTSLPFNEDEYKVIKGCDYDFDNLSNHTAKVIACETMLTDTLPCFSGDVLRLPTNTTGIIQISVSKKVGFLEYVANRDIYADHLFIRARKNKTSPQKWLMYVDDVYDGCTNSLGWVNISYDFEWYVFNLNNLKAGEKLVLHQDNSISTARIIWIDRIIFARKRKHGFCIFIR